MKIRHLLYICIAFTVLTSAINDEFTAQERQQISVETPGLFEQSQAFTIDFGGYRTADYSFPLPVGKATVKDSELEITTEKGDAVKSMFDGTVRLSRHISGHGNVIVVRHDNGLETVYSRNAENLAKVGDKVKAGQTIAIVGGENGRTFLTFYIMMNGGKINPEIIVQPKSHKLTRRTLLFRKKGSRVDMSVVGGEQKSTEKKLEACYPLPGAKVISPYGRRGGRMHSGVDLKTKPNDNILAAFDGEVVMSQRYAAYGNLIKVRHFNGLETWYSHNSKNLVNVGERVKAGQVIALTGQTGRASTAHLHFECRLKGSAVNPSLLFDHGSHTVKADVLASFMKTGKLSKKKR
ncbi:MAG: peptidoglycan DD-metalloendopeptidase family protein [Prevotella sp.]